MAEPKDRDTLGFEVAGALIVATVWYLLIGLLLRIEFLRSHSRSIKIVQYGGAIFSLASAIVGNPGLLFDLLGAARAKKAREKVDEA